MSEADDEREEADESDCGEEDGDVSAGMAEPPCGQTHHAQDQEGQSDLDDGAEGEQLLARMNQLERALNNLCDRALQESKAKKRDRPRKTQDKIKIVFLFLLGETRL